MKKINLALSCSNLFLLLFCVLNLLAQQPPKTFIYRQIDADTLKAYVFQPTTPGENHPAILLFHGGGFKFGDASWCFDRAKEFAENEVILAYDHKSLTTPRTGNGLCALAGWGFIAPSANFIAAFEPNDPRLGLTVDVAGQNVYKIFGELNSNNKGNDDAPSNKIYIRWADVQLWNAEALNETGNYPAAIAIINSIRQRARTSPNADGTMPAAGTLPDRDITSVSKDQIKTWLIQERRVELGFESQRFNDLKRWGLAKTFLTGLGKNFQDKNYLYPIPQGEIDKSGGTITQNTGY